MGDKPSIQQPSDDDEDIPNYPLLSFDVLHFFPDMCTRRHLANKNEELFRSILNKSPSGRFCGMKPARLLGSSSEGLDLPVLLRKNPDGTFVRLDADLDNMMEYDFVAMDYFHLVTHVVDKSIMPGYCRLLAKTQPSNIILRKLAFVEHGWGLYLRSAVSERPVVSIPETYRFPYYEEPLPEPCQIQDYVTETVWEKDNIACIKWGWPHKESNFEQRAKKAKWPPAEIVEEIIQTGCHLVHKSHPSSQHPQIEFRFSFSNAERLLANILSPVVRQCYRVVKALIKCEINDKTSIKEEKLHNFFLKTVVFWLMEDGVQHMENPEKAGFSFLWIINSLIGFLKQKYIPNYFIRDCNLFDCIPYKVVRHWISVLEKIAKNPFASMTRFWVNYDLLPTGWSVTYVSMRSELDIPVNSCSLELLQKAVDKVARYHALSGNHTQLLPLARLGEFLRRCPFYLPCMEMGFNINQSVLQDLVRFLGQSGEENDCFMYKFYIEFYIKLFNTMFEFSESAECPYQKQCAFLLGELGSFHNKMKKEKVRALSVLVGGQLRSAEDCFQLAVSHSNCPSSTKVKYAMFLVSNGKPYTKTLWENGGCSSLQTAIVLLHQLLSVQDKSDDKDSTVYITRHTENVDEFMADELKFRTEASYKASVLAYYLLLSSYHKARVFAEVYVPTASLLMWPRVHQLRKEYFDTFGIFLWSCFYAQIEDFGSAILALKTACLLNNEPMYIFFLRQFFVKAFEKHNFCERSGVSKFNVEMFASWFAPMFINNFLSHVYHLDQSNEESKEKEGEGDDKDDEISDEFLQELEQTPLEIKQHLANMAAIKAAIGTMPKHSACIIS